MTLLASVGALAYVVGPVSAQAPSAQMRQLVRVVATDSLGSTRHVGWLVEVTPETIRLRLAARDSLADFRRATLGSIERGRPKIAPGRAALIGCLALGGTLGALGRFGTHDPDSPGLERTYGTIGLVAGCGIGGIGGLLVSAAGGTVWEPWTLPDPARGSSAVPEHEHLARRLRADRRSFTLPPSTMSNPERSWVTAATYAAGYEADIAVARLQAAGLTAIRRDNDTVGIFGPGFQGATARGVAVLVPSDIVTEARRILEGENDLDEEHLFDGDDADDAD